ncbi:unnamed protein product, partial [Meganyctiphanes norvegica]
MGVQLTTVCTSILFWIIIIANTGTNADASRGQDLLNAAKQGDLDKVKLLAGDACQDVNWRNSFKWTPLGTAAGGNHIDVVKYLISCNSDLNVQAKDAANGVEGWTPLMYASEKGNAVVAMVLMQHGADPLMKTSIGETASDIANKMGFRNIAQLIEQYTINKDVEQHSEEIAELKKLVEQYNGITSAKIHIQFVLTILIAVVVFILVISLIGVYLYFRYKLRSLQLSSKKHAVIFNNDENQKDVHIYEN